MNFSPSVAYHIFCSLQLIGIRVRAPWMVSDGEEESNIALLGGCATILSLSMTHSGCTSGLQEK
jgi:hypothetical protein